MKKLKMNIPLLRKIQRQIVKTPKQFIMAKWFHQDPKIPKCHTAACIGGWAIALINQENPEQSRRRFWESDKDSMTLASEALGLTCEQSLRLFKSECWPNRFLEKPDDDARQAVERIDAFIKSKGRY